MSISERGRRAKARLVALLDELLKADASIDPAHEGARRRTLAEERFSTLLRAVEARIELPREVEDRLTAILTGDPVEPTGRTTPPPASRTRVRATW
jgi:hypothetical protein